MKKMPVLTSPPDASLSFVDSAFDMSKGSPGDHGCHDIRCRRRQRWYFGGLASCVAGIITYPLETVKVQLQTQEGHKRGMLQMAKQMVKKNGIRDPFAGLSGYIVEQLTNSLVRFAVYEEVKQRVYGGQEMPFHAKLTTAAISGLAGMLVGMPADVVHVRMQSDARLPVDERRRYRNGLHGMYVVAREEGVRALYNGATMACTRAVLMNIGQLAFYDQFKSRLLDTDLIDDGVPMHFISSLSAAMVAVLLTQPFDVAKTRMMDDSKNENKKLLHCAAGIARSGPSGFFKGIVPSFLRLGPYTVITFLILEQLRLNFGIDPPSK